MNDKHVLIIDCNDERKNTICEYVTFLEYADVIGRVHHVDEIETSLHEYDTIFVGEMQDNKSSLNILDWLVNNKKNNTPVVFVRNENEKITDIPSTITQQVCAVISHRPAYRDFHMALHLADLYRQDPDMVTKSSGALFRSLVGKSSAIQNVRDLIRKVSNTDANVMILGDSGTGKEVVARTLHYLSDRRDHPFVPVNCGAIPPDLLESELFGHEKGAFTGALTARQGRFELAEGGTLFLDEIGDMPLPMQVKLLRVLQERVFERVGSNKSIKANVRIIAATHRNLETEIENGRFREDLFYRLNVFPIEMPPLCERNEDIPLLIDELITRKQHENQNTVRLSKAVVDSLTHYDWPGNVRELSNLIERLVIMYPNSVVELKDLPERYITGNNVRNIHVTSLHGDDETVNLDEQNIDLTGNGIDLKEYLVSLESTIIQQALDEANGVVAQAAKLLNMRRTTLVEKMRKYGLNRLTSAVS